MPREDPVAVPVVAPVAVRAEDPVAVRAVAPAAVRAVLVVQAVALEVAPEVVPVTWEAGEVEAEQAAHQVQPAQKVQLVHLWRVAQPVRPEHPHR
jgi:hypothetical protein